jgi:hypothetical protein
MSHTLRLIAGPCVIESRDLVLQIADQAEVGEDVRLIVELLNGLAPAHPVGVRGPHAELIIRSGRPEAAEGQAATNVAIDRGHAFVGRAKLREGTNRGARGGVRVATLPQVLIERRKPAVGTSMIGRHIFARVGSCKEPRVLPAADADTTRQRRRAERPGLIELRNTKA